ncbi:MAG TPA: Gfo/Idh/MocA family oxidoreductase [Tepidisphaeraceae bacterium]|jgi:predicted dehydrogenase
MADKIKIGFIGCGQIARIHLNNYAKMTDQVQVVALCDISQACVSEVAKQFNVPHTYTDYKKLLERDDLDAIDVCLHNNFHRPATEAALRAGFHVYCEKPMAGSHRDAAAMVQTAKETGKKLSIQLSTLFAPETRAAKELIEMGELGELYFARSSGFRRRGRPFVDGYGTPTFVQKKNSAGGALYDMGVYHISQILYLLGNPVVYRISGKTYQKTAMDEQRRDRSNYDVEELGIGLVRFANDMTLDLIESWAIHLDNFESSYVVGTKGGVKLDPFGFFRSAGHLNLNASTDLEAARFRWSNVQGDWDLYSSPQHHWINALQGKVDLLPTAELALNTMLISEGIYLSHQRNQEVTAEEVIASSQSTAVVM